MKNQNTFQVGDITIHMLNGKVKPDANIVTYNTMAWDGDKDEIGRNLRAEVTTAFLSGINTVAIPINYGMAFSAGNTLQGVASEVAGSVMMLAERRRIKYTDQPKANPFTLVFVSREASANKNRSVLARLRKAARNSQKSKATAQNNNG